MKKKAIKIAASTAVAASAFVAAAPAQQADAATNVNQLITDAQNAGTVLKWAISVEGTADYKTEPWKEYNAAKDALKKAEAAISGLGTSAKLSAQAKLVDPKVQISRAGAYIDAITSGKKILAKNADFEAAVKTGDLNKVEAAYHVVTEEFRKQTILNYRVYGQSTRDEILKEYKLPIEKTVREYAAEVTVHMLTKSAAVDVKASKYEDAAKKLTEAQALLDAEALTWEEALQKSVNDVEASIPLQVLSVVSDNAKTVTVKFSTKINAGAAILPAGQFTFSNGLIVQAASVAADGKTVTLTTTDQVANTEYALSYQGKATGKSFKTPLAASDTTLTVVESADQNLDNGGERSYTVNVTKADGTPYTGKVKISLLNEDEVVLTSIAQAYVKSVNGQSVTSSLVYEATAVNGKLTFVVADGSSTDATLTVLPKITRVEDNSSKFAPTVTFWALATGNFGPAAVTKVSADETNGFLYLNDKKYSFDANDKYFFKNVETTQAEFFKALSKQDVATIAYATADGKYNKAGISNFVIDTDVTADAALTITNPKGVLTADTNATRLEGKGQPGHIIEVYKGTVATGTAVATATVDGSGSWVVNSLNLTADQKNDFTVTSRPVGTATAASTKTVTIYQQQFATVAGGLYAIDGGKLGEFGIGDTVVLGVPNASLTNNDLKVAKGSTLTFKDGQGRTRTYVVEKIVNTTNQVKVIDVVTSTIVDNYYTGFGNSLNAVTGITNQDNLTFKVSESKDVTLDNGGTLPGTPETPATVADRAALATALGTANTAATTAVAGTEVGNYPQAAIDTYKAAIASAAAVVAADASTKTQVDAAKVTLDAATTAFNAAKITATVIPTATLSSETGALLGTKIVTVKLDTTTDTDYSVTVDGKVLTYQPANDQFIGVLTTVKTDAELKAATVVTKK